MKELLYVRHQQSVGEVINALIAAGALLRSLDGMMGMSPEDWPRFVESALRGRMEDLRRALGAKE